MAKAKKVCGKKHRLGIYFIKKEKMILSRLDFHTSSLTGLGLNISSDAIFKKRIITITAARPIELVKCFLWTGTLPWASFRFHLTMDTLAFD
ncbi:hypothetical protein C8D75_1379 [Petrotoga olearia]|uniref:Uncharacterized protein n=1 Tax=Petrotoga olearia TaxID=156203 RepID=A0ABX9UC73_9BACT|nr:hypothetical protein C8D75_1379 [Petrotoga olearia]